MPSYSQGSPLADVVVIEFQTSAPQSQVIYAGPCSLVGYALAEFSGAASTETDVYNGVPGGSQAFDNINLHGAERDRQNFEPVPCPNGLQIFQLVGSAVGAFFVIPGLV